MALLEVSVSRGGAWIRVLGVGVGLAWRAPVLYSERSGTRKVLRVGPVSIRPLNRWNHP
jgi:hypothetical protein